MSDCDLRLATAEDADAVYDLICELKQQEFDRQAFTIGFTTNLQDHNRRYLLAYKDDQPVGLIGLHMQFHLHHVNWIGEIQELVVAPSARGQGIGKQLLAWAQEQAREAGAELTELSTGVTRQEAHRFYEREGYAQTHLRFTRPVQL